MNVFPFWLKRPTPACTQYGPAGSEKTFVLKVMGALPLGHVLVEASTTRGHDEFAALVGATLPQLRARKVVFIPDLIPQPDWDKCHFFSGMIPYVILRVTAFDFASGLIPVNIEHCPQLPN